MDWTAVDTAVEAGAPRAFLFLERLVAEPSVVGHEEGALRVFADELADLGLAPTWLDLPDDIGDDLRAGVPQPVTVAARRSSAASVPTQPGSRPPGPARACARPGSAGS